MNPPISRWHLERTAFVYLRQSSPQQVKKNVESAERQRRMALAFSLRLTPSEI